MKRLPLHGAGLGFRRESLDELESRVPDVIDFFEVAPENWIDMGGILGRRFHAFAERYPFVCHGLSLSLGGPSPLDEMLLRKIKSFIEQYRVPLYTEHLSYCSDDGHLYDLLPIPMTEEAVKYVAARIRQTQDILERRIAVENASFYVNAPISDMDEPTFVRAVLEEADCDLHLDVNNVYVNSVNHRFDPRAYIASLPAERVVYMHMAGHYYEAEDLIIDTHGADVIDPVWALLDFTYQTIGVRPTLLERDFNIPPLAHLEKEVAQIAVLQRKYQSAHPHAAHA
ncbi:MAG: DUF692 domain-containing protein [Hydrogenophilaceae bacterium]|nr:DUF692 domain-containing protein [Hydrogenophilaceae bacterium]